MSLIRLVLSGTVLWSLMAPPSAASDLDRIRRAGKLTMLCFPQQDNDFIRVKVASGPMRRVGTTAHFEGIDVDILHHAAEALGVALEIRPIEEPSMSELFDALLRGDGDVAAGSVTITSERATRVDFSAPYVPVYSVAVTRMDHVVRSPDDLLGQRVAVMTGSSHAERLKNMGFADDAFVASDFTISMLVAVQDGDADFTVVDSFRADGQAPLPTGLKAAIMLPGEDGLGLAVRPGSDLRAHLDHTIETLRASGELDAIIQHHASWLD